MAKTTLDKVVRGIERFEHSKDALILEGMNNGLNHAAQLSATKYMVGSSGGSRDPIIDPPNPPPGPLKIRSGRLRRGLKVIQARKTGTDYVGALANDVEYAPIHEFGGATNPHYIDAVEADTLAFIGRDGTMVFREHVFHPGSIIPARPFMEPALQDAALVMAPLIEQTLARGFIEAIEGSL